MTCLRNGIRGNQTEVQSLHVLLGIPITIIMILRLLLIVRNLSDISYEYHYDDKRSDVIPRIHNNFWKSFSKWTKLVNDLKNSRIKMKISLYFDLEEYEISDRKFINKSSS
jgi:hypothetical protein